MGRQFDLTCIDSLLGGESHTLTVTNGRLWAGVSHKHIGAGQTAIKEGNPARTEGAEVVGLHIPGLSCPSYLKVGMATTAGSVF